MTRANSWGDEREYDFGALVDSLNRYLRLRTNPVGMERFAQASELEALRERIATLEGKLAD